jgi:hypothetical protein
MDGTLPVTWHLPTVDRRLLNLLAVVGLFAFWLYLQRVPEWVDAHGYWYSTQPGVDLYGRQWNVDADAFVYSPVAALALKALTWMPWQIFYGLWSALLIGTLVWLICPAWALVALLIPGFAGYEVMIGNISLLFAATFVIALSGRASAWAFPLFTKVTPAVGVLWHVLRREWSALAELVVVSLLLVALSLVLLPSAWSGWFEVLWKQGPPLPDALVVIPLAVRLPVAVGIVIVAAQKDWRWLVPVACWAAQPNFSLLPGAVMLLAIPRLLRDRAHPHHPNPSETRRPPPGR